MDPNATLAEIRSLLADYHDADKREGFEELDTSARHIDATQDRIERNLA